MQRLGGFGPNWFTTVMGTGIVANAATLLPRPVPGLRDAATVVWVLAALVLVALVARTVRAGWGEALRDPAALPFLGAPPMAILTVGSGALLLGHAPVPAFALWCAGTATGLLSCLLVPYLMFTRAAAPDPAPTWLLPVVPPMVSAATGAALVAHLPAGEARLDMVLACYAMFGISLLASVVTIALVWGRLAAVGHGPAERVPTLFIVLGPLGQSVTAACLLGDAADGVLPDPYATGVRAAGIVFGVPVLGFALLWLALAAAITARAARGGLPFAMTWWSFTFPVGTTATGAACLAVRTGSDAVAWLAVALYVLLVTGWAAAASGTLRGLLVAAAPESVACPPTRPHRSPVPSSPRSLPSASMAASAPQPTRSI